MRQKIQCTIKSKQNTYKEIKKHRNPNNGEETTLYDVDRCGQQTIKIKDKQMLKSISYRRVSSNEQAAIQFSCEEHNLKTNRSKHFSFSLPENMAVEFLEHLSKPGSSNILCTC